MPTSMAVCSSTAFSSAYLRTSSVIFIEQKCGPHIEQKCDVFAASCGRVSSWNDLAVSGSSERLNWSSQRNSKRADRKSTRLNSSHSQISYAVFCLKKKNKKSK